MKIEIHGRQVDLKFRSPSSAIKPEMIRRLGELAGHSLLMDAGSEEHDLAFLRLLEDFLKAGAKFGDLSGLEDNCPLCIDLKKQMVFNVLTGKDHLNASFEVIDLDEEPGRSLH